MIAMRLPLLATVLLGACGGSTPPAPFAACRLTGEVPPVTTGMADIGGFSLYYEIHGTRRAGRPVVVFDHGGGEDHMPWLAANVQQAIAQATLTVSYDRAGQGQSEDSNLPKTAAEQARQLRELLIELGLPPPYLLVSHSIAGLNARVFADEYPGEVHGVVFVDSSHEGMNEGEWQPITAADVSSSGEMNYAEFSQSAQQARDTRTRDFLRDKPIAVLSATCHGPCNNGVSIVDEEGWMEFQRDIASLSTYSVHVVAPPGSEHHLMTTQPQLVIDGICGTLLR